MQNKNLIKILNTRLLIKLCPRIVYGMQYCIYEINCALNFNNINTPRLWILDKIAALKLYSISRNISGL